MAFKLDKNAIEALVTLLYQQAKSGYSYFSYAHVRQLPNILIQDQDRSLERSQSY